MKTRKTARKQAIFLLVIVVTVCLASEAGGIWVDPNSFGIDIPEGCTLTETLTIGNDGIEDLNFTLRSREISREILGGLSGGGTAEPAVKLAKNEIVLKYRFGEPVVSRGAKYDVVRLEGMETYHRTGAPIVPVRPVTVLVPFGKKVVSTRVIALKTRELPGTYRLPPAQEPYPLSHVGPIVQTEPNSVIYNQATQWPGILHEKVTTQSKRGYQLFTVNLFPMQYVPTTGKVTYTTKMRLEIELADSAVTNVLRPSENTKKALRKRVDNPNLLGSYDAKAMPVERVGGEAALPSGGPYQYVIITNQALESASGPWNFQALRDAKIAHGMTATIVTTEWIYSNYDGTRPDGGSDNQTRIRNFLIEAYQDWGTEYVLLGGINGIVPARMFRVDGVYMPVDMYYGCVDPEECTFDGDADGIYGESNDGVGGGDVDLYGEVYVGRAAVENATEVANFVQKTLAYNSTHNDYISLISMLGEHLGFGGVAEYAKPAMEQIRLGGDYDGYFTYGFENHTQPDFYDFDTSTNLYDADGSWPKSELISLMNEGVHIFNHLGHANYTYDMKLYVSDLASLTNTDYFFAYSQGCDPGGFDATNCFAEVITTMEYGAFAVVMNARSGWGRGNSTDGPSQRFARQFWDAALNEDMLEMGRANQDSKEDNLWDINGSYIRWCYYELTLFGDPAQELRFKEACEWLTTEPQEGSVGPNSVIDVNITFDAVELAPGTYEAEIVITSNDPCSPTIVPVTMTVAADDLQVTPAEGFESSGTEGGPFEPQCVVYTLTNNNGTESVNWTTWETEDWLAVEPNEGVLDPCETMEIDVCISAGANSLDPNLYTQILTFQNTDSNSIKPRPVTLTVKPPDCFTESFDEGGSDLEGLMVTFSPDGSGAYYEACREEVDEFLTDPNGGTYVALWDDDFAEVFLGGQNPQKKISFYGTSYNRFYIGSNGYITFGDGDTEFESSLENHFNMLRISGVFADLTPPSDQCISYKQLGDRVAVTFEDVPIFGDKDATNSFQIEMFYADGTIRITWLKAAKAECVAGLSRGRGLPPVFFEESDLSEYPPCWPWCDLNKDYYVNFKDFAIFAKHWLDEDCSIPYWCGKADMDLSSTVDYDDLAICAANWLVADEWWLQPVSHWKFDEGEGTTAHDSAGDNDGTIYDATWTNGKIGDYALDFDGDGDYVEVPYNSNLNPNIFTVSVWAKAGIQPSWASSVITSRDYFKGYVIYAEHNNYWEFWIGDGSSWEILKGNAITSDEWVHLVAVYDGSYMRFYNDGDLVGSPVEHSFSKNTQAPARIGAGATESSPMFYFNGTIDDVRIYDRALSAEEILELYEEGRSYKATNPNPDDGATNIDPNTVLSWSPGKDAISHDVYLGTDFDDVNDANTSSAVYMGNFDVNSYDACGLDLLTTYFWRIDEVTDSNTYEGDVWSFKTWIEPNFISWWKFDEGGGDMAYDSAGNNDGTLMNGPAWTTGQIDGALSFDGVNDYVDLGNDTSLKPALPVTLSAWIKLDSLGSYQKFMTLDDVSFKYCGVWFELADEDNLVINYGDGAGSGPNYRRTKVGTTVLQADTWYQVAAVVRGATDMDLYINAVDDGGSYSGTGGSLAYSDGNSRIGGSDFQHHYFDGIIDDVRIYDRVLDAGEIWQLFYEGLGPKAYNPHPADGATGVDPNTVLSWSPGKDAISHDVYLGTDFDDVNDANTSSAVYMGNFDVNSFDPCGLEYETLYYWRIDELDGSNTHKGDVWSFTTWVEFDPNFGLVGWWEFEEGSGSDANDSAGDNDGTLVGDTNWVTGKIGDYALDFDGDGDYVEIVDDSSLNIQGPFTLSAWVKTPNAFNPADQDYHNIIAKDSIFVSGYGLEIYERIFDSSVRLGVWSRGTSFKTVNCLVTGLWQANTWYHVVGVYNGTDLMIYWNGELKNTGAGVNPGDTTGDSLYIGTSSDGDPTEEPWNGTIDDVRIYDRALDAGEIWQLYQGGLGE